MKEVVENVSQANSERPIDSEHNYRINVLATFKAISWLVVLATLVAMVWSGQGQFISDWIEVSFLDTDFLERWILTPVSWTVIAAAGSMFVYSTVIKWLWDSWDREAKYLPADTTAKAPTKGPAGAPGASPDTSSDAEGATL